MPTIDPRAIGGVILATIVGLSCRQANRNTPRPTLARDAQAAIDVPQKTAARTTRDDEGFFSNTGPSYESDKLAPLREVLRKYTRRFCELITVPAEGTEATAVFLVREPDGRATVVRVHENERVFDTATAGIDATTAETLSAVCSDALALHSPPCCEVKDGAMFYASHWTSAGQLSGWAESPRRGTVADLFVDFGWALQQFAEEQPAQRETARQKLSAATQALSARVTFTP